MLSPAENRKIWTAAMERSRDLLDGRVKNDIEKHRKGWCKLRFTDENGEPLKNMKVKVDQATHDFGFGANIFMLDEFEDPKYNEKYREQFKEYFNVATVPFYWDGVEPDEGQPRYDKHSKKVYRRPAPELCMEYCEENGITPKLHCLVYDKFIPKWTPRNDMEKMEALYEERMRQISERFSGRMLEFEVINELLLEPRWDYKSVISNKHDIVEWAFDLARKYFPDEALVINEADHVIELAEERYRDAYFLLVENALRNGVDIDKIGLQYHIFTGATTANDEEYEKAVLAGDKLVDPDLILKGLDIIAQLCLPLELTEVTVTTLGETEEDEELQADLLELLYSVWFSHPAVNTVVYWNVPDGYAYIDPDRKDSLWNENKCRGGLWHHDLTPKKSALRLHKLVHDVWHTTEELTADENGYVEFRGFYGEYTAEAGDFAASFGIHKGDSEVTEIIL